MTPNEKYYIFLACLLVLGLFIQVIPSYIKANSTNQEHYLGVNVSEKNGTCVYTWLGGWDYESFIGDVRVDDIVWTHPNAGTVIAINKSCNLSVEMYMRDVKSWVQIYPKV